MTPKMGQMGVRWGSAGVKMEKLSNLNKTGIVGNFWKYKDVGTFVFQIRDHFDLSNGAVLGQMGVQMEFKWGQMGSKWKNYSNWIKLAHFSILTPIWPLLAPFLESKWSQIRKSSFPMYFYSQKLCTHQMLFKSDNFSILTPTWPPFDPH